MQEKKENKLEKALGVCRSTTELNTYLCNVQIEDFIEDFEDILAKQREECSDRYWDNQPMGVLIWVRNSIKNSKLFQLIEKKPIPNE